MLVQGKTISTDNSSINTNNDGEHNNVDNNKKVGVNLT
jgi:hypothetical protein